MATKRLEDDKIKRQLRCKICDMGLHFRVLQEVPYKGEIQLHDAGGGGEPVFTLSK
jgi:hypothetical protein